jgi:hypothetical protein
MSWWSFYSNTTGAFLPQTFGSSNPDAVALNTPAGYTAMAGQYNAATQKVDLTQAPPAVVPIT